MFTKESGTEEPKLKNGSALFSSISKTNGDG